MYNYIERDHFANALQKYNIFCTYANPLSVIKRKRTIMEADFLVLDGVFCKETKRAPLTSRSASVQQRETLMLGFLQEDLQVDNKTKVPIIFRYKVSEESHTPNRKYVSFLNKGKDIKDVALMGAKKKKYLQIHTEPHHGIAPHYHIWENGHPLTGDHALTPHMMKILKIVQNYGNRS